MNKNNKIIDPLNETIIGEIIPLAFSTEIKQRQPFHKKVNIDYSFDTTTFSEASNDENKVISVKDIDNQMTIRKKPVIKENQHEISARYLVQHEKPTFDFDSSDMEDKMPLRDANINQPNSRDFSYFKRVSNPISELKSCIINEPSKELTISESSFQPKLSSTVKFEQQSSKPKDDTLELIRRVDSVNLNNTTVTYFDELIEDLDLCESLNVTKLANDLKKSEIKKLNKKDLTKEDCHIKDVILLSNKVDLLWLGVAVQTKEHDAKFDNVYNWLYHNNLIKSFTLNLRSSLPQKVHIALKGNSDCFFLTNNLGNNKCQFLDVLFEPKTDRKFYVTFHPTNSNYHTDMIIISVGERKFKIKLFGYAEPAIVDLKGFYDIENLNNTQKKSLVKDVSQRISKGSNSFTVSVFNSGARTAFVALRKLDKNSDIKFEPRMFLLIPKTKMEFNVSVTLKGDETMLKFYMFSVDEELRRATRTSIRDLPHNSDYNIYNNIGIFTNLLQEKTICQDDLPKFDWRKHLCRKINESHRECCFNFNHNSNDSSSTVGQLPPSESITTIGMVSRSSLTGYSALNNIECLDYMNLTENFVRSLQESLSSVIIHNDVNTFTPTCVKMTNYLGILIRNNNQFPVEWVISGMTCVSRNSLFDRNIIDKSNNSSIYSLNSIPIYDPASCMSILNDEGCLGINEAVVIPVAFTPQNTGKIVCKCTVKMFSRNDDDTRMEKELEFMAEAFRKEQCRFLRSEIPNFEIDRIYEAIVRLSDLKDDKYQIQLSMRNKASYVQQIFASRLKTPFDLKVTNIFLTEKKSLLCINFKAPGKGVFKEVLILCDQEGNSTFVPLAITVK